MMRLLSKDFREKDLDEKLRQGQQTVLNHVT
jgi:hypothetical protein